MPIERKPQKFEHASPEVYRANRQRFLAAKQQKWNFKSMKILNMPGSFLWEKRLLVKALPIVMKYKIEGRKINETDESIGRIMPIAAQELNQEMQRQLPPRERAKAAKFLDYFSGNFSRIFKLYQTENRFSEETLKITKETGKKVSRPYI